MKIFAAAFLFFIFIFSFPATGQEEPAPDKFREFFLSFSDFSPFSVSISHKRQFKENTFLKFGLVDMSLMINSNFSKNALRTSLAYSLGIETGIEFRKAVSENFTFYHGPNVSLTYGNYISRVDTIALPAVQTPSYSGSVPYTLGMLVKIKDHFFVSAEINPGITILYKKYSSTNYNISTNLNFSNRFALLSLAYRI